MPDRLARLARRAGRLAIDTEFMAERRYQSLLCLAQVAVRDEAQPPATITRIIDPIAGDQPGELAGALADREVEVVVHAGRQDVALLKRTWGTEVRNLFDTQVAAGFLGFGMQESYRTLVNRVLGVRIRSAESFTRWERRPLTDEQLRYAAEDAEHLLELGEELERRLAEAGRLDWVREECRALEDVSDERDADTVFLRLPGVARLKPAARAVARELVEWREEVARRIDRNAGSVLPDHVLVEVARQAPARVESLDDVRGMPEATRHRRGRDLIAAIARGMERTPPDIPPGPPPTSSKDAPLTALLGAVVRHRAQEAGVATQLIATQDDLARLVTAVRAGDGAPELRVLTGWRRDLAGAELLDVLAGERAVRVGSDMRLQLRE